MGDLAGNAAATAGVGHQHAVAAGQRQVGGERRALVAALFLDDLNQQDLPALDDFLDLVAAQRARTAALSVVSLVPAKVVDRPAFAISSAPVGAAISASALFLMIGVAVV